jgi:hypothetical protein
MTDPTVCAALYFDRAEAGPIPVAWLDEALRLLAQTGIPVHESSITGVPGFDPERTQPFAPNQAGLRAGLASGSAQSIYLLGHPSRQEGLTLRCRTSAAINCNYGYSYVGVPEQPGLTPRELLLATYALTRLVTPCRYGIVYRRSAHLSPSLYARGMLGDSGEAPDKEDLETTDRIFRFVGEMQRGKRHLRGGFRSVYPAQLLCEAHRATRLPDGTTIAELGLGVWTPVAGGLWLWELTDTELASAKELMEHAGLLLAA